MAAGLLRKLSQAALSSLAKLGFSSCACFTGDSEAAYKPLSPPPAKKKREQYFCIATVGRGRPPAYGCSCNGKLQKKPLSPPPAKKKKEREQYFCIAAVGREPPAYGCCCNGKLQKKVPKGYLPVLLVGNLHDDDDVSVASCCNPDVSGGRACLYAIRVCLLGHPLLCDLLNRSFLQFGYSKYAGALRLPCDTSTFESLLALITSLEVPQ